MMQEDNSKDVKREDSITSQFQSPGRGSVYIVGDFFVNPIRESTTTKDPKEDIEANPKPIPTNTNDGIRFNQLEFN